MRPSFLRLVNILSRNEIPRDLHGRIIARLPMPSETPPTLTLIDHLAKLKEKRTNEYLVAQEEAQERGALNVPEIIHPWPVNLRIEPVVKRAEFQPLVKGVGRKLKALLNER